MIGRLLLLVVAVLPLAQEATAWPWSQDMMNQPSIKPQEPYKGRLFRSPRRAIPITGRPTQVPDRNAANSLKNPFAPTSESISQGRQLYTIYCSACHGATGQADTPVSQLLFAANLSTQRVQQELTEGWLWGTITFGSTIMPGYGRVGPQGGSNDLTSDERWHVVNFVRHGLPKKPTVALTTAPPAATDRGGSESASSDEVSVSRGEVVYSRVCIACHSPTAAAVTKAPGLGDSAAWKERISQGRAVLFEHATTPPGYNGPNGGFMPARGGRPELTDSEIRSAIEFMISRVNE